MEGTNHNKPAVNKDYRILDIHNICCYYGNIQALHQTSLYINQGEIVSLIGSNGAGKTTMLMSIFGDPVAQTGEIIFDGKNITNLPTHQISYLGIGLVPEGRRIFAQMSVEENLQIGSDVLNCEYFEEDRTKVFDLFPRLKERRNQLGGTLSGGEQQMLAIGRALMTRPKLLLLDEPSLGIAPLVIAQIFSSISEIAKQGVTVFLVEQNAFSALKIADRAYVLVNGKIELSGKAEDLINNPNIKKAYLGGS